jgi:hypothetical protein
VNFFCYADDSPMDYQLVAIYYMDFVVLLRISMRTLVGLTTHLIFCSCLIFPFNTDKAVSVDLDNIIRPSSSLLFAIS